MAYVKTTWATGDLITATKLNNAETGIEGALPKDGSGAMTGRLPFDRPTAESDLIVVRVTGDAVDRFRVQADGKMEWGPGNGARDTNLYRSATNTLKTDDNFQAAGITALSNAVVVDNPGAANTHYYIRIQGVNRGLLFADYGASLIGLRYYKTDGVWHQIHITDSGEMKGRITNGGITLWTASTDGDWTVLRSLISQATAGTTPLQAPNHASNPTDSVYGFGSVNGAPIYNRAGAVRVLGTDESAAFNKDRYVWSWDNADASLLSVANTGTSAQVVSARAVRLKTGTTIGNYARRNFYPYGTLAVALNQFDWSKFRFFQCEAQFVGAFGTPLRARWGMGTACTVGDGVTSKGMFFAYYEGSLWAYVTNGTAGQLVDITASVTVTAKNRYRITFDGTTARFYVDTGSGFPTTPIASITLNIPSGTEDYGPGVYLETRSGSSYELTVAQMYSEIAA